MSKTSLLALSSPEGSDNYYSKFINTVDEDTGLSFFKIVDCFMICEACRKLEDREERIKCDHVKQAAFWLSKRKAQRLLQLYKADPARAEREFGGMISDGFTPCFRQELLDRMFNAAPVGCKSTPKYIFVAVDPNGGGPSQMAIVSGYYDGEMNFVVSLSFILEAPSCIRLQWR